MQERWDRRGRVGAWGEDEETAWVADSGCARRVKVGRGSHGHFGGGWLSLRWTAVAESFYVYFKWVQMLGIACFAAMGIGENVVCCGELFGGEHFGERWDLSTEYGAPGTFGEKVKSEMRLLASIENEPLFVAMPGDRHDQCNSNGTPSHPAQHSTASNPSLQLDIQLQLVREPRDGYVKICYRRVSPRTQSSRNHIFQSHTSKVPLGTMNDENHMKETPTKKKIQ